MEKREREREKLLGNAFSLKFIHFHVIKRISNAINIIKIERFYYNLFYTFLCSCIKIIIMNIIFYNKILILSL